MLSPGQSAIQQSVILLLCLTPIATLFQNSTDEHHESLTVFLASISFNIYASSAQNNNEYFVVGQPPLFSFETLLHNLEISFFKGYYKLE